jgi:hypothetical protein
MSCLYVVVFPLLLPKEEKERFPSSKEVGRALRELVYTMSCAP